jgi:predicted RNA-binding Zn-ribbon protein involved in translation (DUF1610 family)
MEDDPRGEPQRTDEANRLYWHSELGVNQIAEEMGVSKGALYTLVNPLAAGLSCPRCDSELMFPNRTARDRGFVSCSNCGFEEELSELEASPAPARKRKAPAKAGSGAKARPEGSKGGSEAEEASLDGDDPVLDRAREALSRENTRILVGSGLIAIAAGVMLTRWLRRD